MHTQWARSDPFRLTPLATLSLTRVFAMKAAPTHPNMKLNPEQAPCSYISSNYQQTPKSLQIFKRLFLSIFIPTVLGFSSISAFFLCQSRFVGCIHAGSGFDPTIKSGRQLVLWCGLGSNYSAVISC